MWDKSTSSASSTHPIRDIAGSTLGIIGYGALGKSIAKRAEALGMKVLIIRRTAAAGQGRFRDDPARERRHHAQPAAHAGDQEHDRREGAYDDEDVRHASSTRRAAASSTRRRSPTRCASGIIGGAGFDVLTNEPPKNGNILLDPTIPNLIVTPHVAWASKEAMQMLADQLIDNIEAFVAGKPHNVVTA